MDEHEHGTVSYPPHCELVRVCKIAQAVGKPLILVRHNPDEFKIGVMTERLSTEQRHALLLEVLKEHFAQGSAAFLTVTYICYSQAGRLSKGEKRPYVTTARYATELDYEWAVGNMYPNGCDAAPAGTPYYTKT